MDWRVSLQIHTQFVESSPDYKKRFYRATTLFSVTAVHDTLSSHTKWNIENRSYLNTAQSILQSELLLVLDTPFFWNTTFYYSTTRIHRCDVDHKLLSHEKSIVSFSGDFQYFRRKSLSLSYSAFTRILCLCVYSLLTIEYHDFQIIPRQSWIPPVSPVRTRIIVYNVISKTHLIVSLLHTRRKTFGMV